jgi:hypothetical protein
MKDFLTKNLVQTKNEKGKHFEPNTVAKKHRRKRSFSKILIFVCNNFSQETTDKLLRGGKNKHEKLDAIH